MCKIFSMSVWGDNPRYIFGARQQICLAKEFHPDFEVRIYTNKPGYFQNLDANIIECSGKNGYFWRFFPLFEDENNITIVRDADSRITYREKNAVDSWLYSDKKFHTIKDHEAHFQFPIMAGLFGYKGVLSQDLFNIMLYFINSEEFYTNDQIFLKEYVWKEVQNSCIIHDNERPGWFKSTRELLKNRYSFCGNGFDENNLPLYPPFLDEIKEFSAVDKSKFIFDKGELEFLTL